jgi:hypothetical protein
MWVIGEEKKLCKILVGKPKERYHSEDQGVDGRMGSQLVLRRLAGGEVDSVGS